MSESDLQLNRCGRLENMPTCGVLYQTKNVGCHKANITMVSKWI